jgi:hypothetical protein
VLAELYTLLAVAVAAVHASHPSDLLELFFQLEATKDTHAAEVARFLHGLQAWGFFTRGGVLLVHTPGAVFEALAMRAINEARLAPPTGWCGGLVEFPTGGAA